MSFLKRLPSFRRSLSALSNGSAAPADGTAVASSADFDVDAHIDGLAEADLRSLVKRLAASNNDVRDALFEHSKQHQLPKKDTPSVNKKRKADHQLEKEAEQVQRSQQDAARSSDGLDAKSNQSSFTPKETAVDATSAEETTPAIALKPEGTPSDPLPVKEPKLSKKASISSRIADYERAAAATT